MKSKKILGLLLVVTLLSATVFGTASVFAAGAQTNVSLKSYMPPVKTIFVDDDFENRTVDGGVAPVAKGEPGYRANQIKEADKAGAGFTAKKENDNIYAYNDMQYKTIRACDKVISTSADRLVISFKFNVNTRAVGDDFMLRFGSSNSARALRFLWTSKNRVEIYKFITDPTTSTGYNTQWLCNIDATASKTWIDLTLVLIKSGSGDSAVAKIDKMFVNGTEAKISAGADELLADCNWWKNVSDPTEKLNAINIGNAKGNGYMFDDILIYEPYDVYMTDIDAAERTVKIVNDGSNAVTGNVFIALYDNDKNLLAAKEASTELSVPAGGSQTLSLDDNTFGHENAKTAKIFFWNKSSLAPLCAAETVPLS